MPALLSKNRCVSHWWDVFQCSILTQNQVRSPNIPLSNMSCFQARCFLHPFASLVEMMQCNYSSCWHPSLSFINYSVVVLQDSLACHSFSDKPVSLPPKIYPSLSEFLALHSFFLIAYSNISSRKAPSIAIKSNRCSTLNQHHTTEVILLIVLNKEMDNLSPHCNTSEDEKWTYSQNDWNKSKDYPQPKMNVRILYFNQLHPYASNDNASQFSPAGHCGVRCMTLILEVWKWKEKMHLSIGVLGLWSFSEWPTRYP